MRPILLLMLPLFVACGDKDTDEPVANDTGETSSEEEGSEEEGAEEEGSEEEGSEEEGSEEEGVEESLWLDVVYPLVEDECIDCHGYWGDNADDVHNQFTTFTSDKGGPYVTPGDPDQSYIFEKVSSDEPSNGKQMPIELSDVSSNDLDKVASWIDSGAAEDSVWNDQIYELFQRYKCTQCHQAEWGKSPEEVYAAISSASFGPVDYVVPGDSANSALYLKMTDSPPAGERMPLVFEHWDDDEVAAIRQWIEDGAPSE